MKALEVLRREIEGYEQSAANSEIESWTRRCKEHAAALSRIEAVIDAAQGWALARRELESMEGVATEQDAERVNNVLARLRKADRSLLAALSALEEDTHADGTHQ